MDVQASLGQIIVRCLDHKAQGRDAPYIAYVEPVGDGLAVRCAKCSRQGVVWLKATSLKAWEEGSRDFYPNTSTLRVRVGEEVHFEN